jgi:Peptidase C39 family
MKESRAKALVDRAIGELIRMHARIGHADLVEVLLKQVENRHVSGPATEAVTGAKEGLWMMRHDPGVSYLCGPMALKNLLLALGIGHQNLQLVNEYRSGAEGVTLDEVANLAERVNLPYRLIFRSADQPIPVPSIVHWKVSHYAAIIGETSGRILGRARRAHQLLFSGPTLGIILLAYRPEAARIGGFAFWLAPLSAWRARTTASGS